MLIVSVIKIHFFVYISNTHDKLLLCRMKNQQLTANRVVSIHSLERAQDE